MPLTKIQSLGITDGTIVNADINASAAIASSKLSGSLGKVLQVVSTSLASAAISTTSTSFADVTGFTASITPSSASNKILILVNMPSYVSNSGNGIYLTILRGATNLGSSVRGFGYLRGGADTFGVMSANYLDSPNTTSSTTYKLQFKVDSGSTGEFTSPDGARGTLTLIEIAA